MTATVGTLLDNVHARAWELCSRAGEVQAEASRERQIAELLAAWPRLAISALRVLDAVRVEPVWLDDTSGVREVLQAVSGHKALAPQSAVGGVDSGAARPAVWAIAARLRAIADLLGGQPAATTEVDRAALVGLQANVVAVVHAVAVTTLATLGDRGEVPVARSLMRGILARGERFAVMPTARRTGRYEDVAAVASDDPSLDAAITQWLPATVGVLTSRHRVTQTTLQVAAGDALILIAAASAVLSAASQLGFVAGDVADRAHSALAGAHGAWRPCVSWPATVRLDGGRDVDQVHASRRLRELITDSLREGRTWLPAETMVNQFDLGSLMGSMRRGLHAIGNVALAHVQAMDGLVRGPGRLWIDATAVTQPAYRNYATIEAACRKGWVLMPPGESAGLALLADAKQTLTTTTIAVAALDATASVAASSTQRGAGGLQWDRGRIVACGADDQPRLFETVHSQEPAGARSERRTPVRLGGPRQSSPRR